MFKYSFRIRLCPFYHVTGLLLLTSHFNWVSTGLRFGTTLRTIIRMIFSGLFSFMLLKCVIPERIVIGSGVCACRPRLETIAYCFLNCARVKKVWDNFSPLLSSLLGIQFDVNIPSVFFLAWPSPCFKISRIVRFLITSILCGIWCFRNKATFVFTIR